MKHNIHPHYQAVSIKCTHCDTIISTRSTLCKDINIDICSNCHPFHSRKSRTLDDKGQVYKFRQRFPAKAIRPHSFQS